MVSREQIVFNLVDQATNDWACPEGFACVIKPAAKAQVY
jgi:hypothetical protein